MVVVRFICVRCDKSGAPWLSLVSFGRALSVSGFIRVHWGHSGSFRHGQCVVGFIRARSVYFRFHSGLLRSIGCAQGSAGSLWFVEFIRASPCVSLRSFGCALRVVGFIRVYWDHSRVVSGLFWFVGWFVRAVRSGGSFERALVVLGLIWFCCVHSSAYWWSLGSFRGVLLVIRLIPVRWVHSGLHWGSSVSFGFVRFIRTHPGGRWLHLGSFRSFICGQPDHLGSIRCALDVTSAPSVLLSSFERALRVSQFILAHPWGRWVYLGALWGSLVSLGFVRFIRARRPVQSDAP